MTAPRARRFDAVLFDVHSTLIDQGDAEQWLDAALGDTGDSLDETERRRIAILLDRVWEHAREIDPLSRRDVDSRAHHDVFAAILTEHFGVSAALTAALYRRLLDTWVAYDDAAPTLTALRGWGVHTVAMSNVGIDISGMLDRVGLWPLLDHGVFSYAVGVVKPAPEIFQIALDLAGVPAERALMVGDSWADDAAAAALGIRTLVLPRTRGPVHGLDQVLDLVSGPHHVH